MAISRNASFLLDLPDFPEFAQAVRYGVPGTLLDELIDATVLPATGPGAMVYTDEWNGYKPLARCGRGHATVNHNRGEFARDDDGDGVREVHCSTLEGIWTGLRNFLRPFRNVNKVYLSQYIIMLRGATSSRRSPTHSCGYCSHVQ